MREFDVIVVGAGAAGAALAGRLSEKADLRVLLVEAGGRARGPLFSVPLMTGLLLRSSIANWGYRTEPEAELGGRVLAWPRGRALGGSTAINGMLYMRGLASDYDRWAQLGLAGWSWSDVAPVFRRLERVENGSGAERGRHGPLAIAEAAHRHPLFHAFLEAAVHAGHPRSPGFNGLAPAGVGPYEFTIRRGRRWSTARAYLDPARQWPNLEILTGAAVARVEIERGRATGICIVRNGRSETIRAAREVVLCAGTVGSPQLLMLSGIGPADELRTLGIHVETDLPGVGKNLQDHLLVRVMHATGHPGTVDDLRRLDRAALAFAQAWLTGTGPAASFPIEVGGLIRSEPSLDEVDLQAAFMPGLSSYTLHLPFIGMARMQLEGRGFFANVFQMRPESRGEIQLASADPSARPRIMPRYLSAPRDLIVLREGVKRLREIFAQAAFDRWRGEELAPGADIRSDAEIDAFIRATADTVFHPVGTCAMGPDRDPSAVLDAALRVRGVEGLRVADASAMPHITSSNTMAPSIMIGERCADFLLGRTTVGETT